MKKLMLFYLQSCPFCQRALQYMEELKQENPEYAKIPLLMVEETKERELAASYDYYYVPCFYVDGQKLMEGRVTKDDVKSVYEACL